MVFLLVYQSLHYLCFPCPIKSWSPHFWGASIVFPCTKNSQSTSSLNTHIEWSWNLMFYLVHNLSCQKYPLLLQPTNPHPNLSHHLPPFRPATTTRVLHPLFLDWSSIASTGKHWRNKTKTYKRERENQKIGRTQFGGGGVCGLLGYPQG